MIVVDSSVWIAFFRAEATEKAEQLEEMIGKADILVGDLIACEVLKGVASTHMARRVEAALVDFETVRMLDLPLAIRAAENFRKLRSLGITIRSTVDLLIGTFCIENRHALLHSDRDFDAMRDHLGLITV